MSSWPPNYGPDSYSEIVCPRAAALIAKFMPAAPPPTTAIFLNFRQSDRIDDAVVHIRCFPNPLHHTFGLGATDKPTLNHLTFNVHHIDDIGRAKVRMEEAGVPVVYGPGRHPQSGSIFFYFLDPDGLTIEYSQGMEEFPEDNPRPPRRFPLEGGVFDYWNGKPKPGFTAVGAIG